MQNIKQVETIFVVMFENRSFDHLMGYLSLPPYNRPVEGLLQAGGLPTIIMGSSIRSFTCQTPRRSCRTIPRMNDRTLERSSIRTGIIATR
jgi:hypothetical protein